MIFSGLSHLLSCAVDFLLCQVCLVPVILVPANKEPDVVSTVEFLLVHLTEHSASGNYVKQSDDNARVLVISISLFLLVLIEIA